MNSNRSLRSNASSYADDARGLGHQALESTRDFANQAFERANAKMRDLRYGMKDLADRMPGSVNDYAQATTRYVSEQPVKSALIAAAVGAAVAGLVLALRRNSSSDRRYY
jgi:ElaB/YqjD/DUF883 family membrane-anchored ribosome-binding protein